MFRQRILPWMVWCFYRLLTLSWRKTVIEPLPMQLAIKNREPIILAHWHGDELALTFLVRRYRLATMTSTSKDGQLMDFVIRKLGGHTSRGSSTRGGIQALKGLIRLCREGHPTSMAVDGPKGPLHQVKAGVFELSRMTGAMIVPVGAQSQSALNFKKSWNQAFLPYPFTKTIVVFGEPLPAVLKTQDPKSAELAKELADRIFAAQRQASKLIAQQ